HGEVSLGRGGVGRGQRLRRLPRRLRLRRGVRRGAEVPRGAPLQDGAHQPEPGDRVHRRARPRPPPVVLRAARPSVAPRARGDTMSLPPVDRVSITTVVDNSVDVLRVDEKVARRWSVLRARKFTDLRAEHGLAHHVAVTRGRETARIAFDFGLTAGSMTHNFRELGLDAGAIDALALSHGHTDHFGGLLGFLSTYRGRLRSGLRFYGHPNHYVARFMEREGTRVFIGRLDRADVGRWDLDVVDVPEPVILGEGVLLSGEMRTPEPYEAIPPSLRMEEAGALVQDTF